MKSWARLRTWVHDRVLNDYSLLTVGRLAAEARHLHLAPDDWLVEAWNKRNAPRKGATEPMPEDHPYLVNTREQRITGGLMAMIAKVLSSLDDTFGIGTYHKRRFTGGRARWQTFQPDAPSITGAVTTAPTLNPAATPAATPAGEVTSTIRKRISSRHRKSREAINQINSLPAPAVPTGTHSSEAFSATPASAPRGTAEPQAVVPLLENHGPTPAPAK
jgi:hypothetical protein